MASSLKAKDPARLFIRQDVQELLVKLTGFDLSKIFKPDFNTTLQNSDIQLLTQSQLESEQKRAVEDAKRLLQMPPFLKPRSATPKILAKDEKLSPLNKTNSNYMFIDISLNVPDHKRMMVVREPNGTLRDALFQEREKLLQVYFPKPGNSVQKPLMFEPEHLENCLKNKKYLLVLKKACVKFEPDDAEFIRVTHRVYEYINEVRDYEQLYSTRFYGPMVFYLAWYQKLDNLVSYLIEKGLFNDCVDLIRLYMLLHSNEAKLAKLINEKTSPEDTIKMFIKSELRDNASSELALNNYLKSKKKSSAKN